jgi:LysR family nitrogen assimilation transcriptional regulator
MNLRQLRYFTGVVETGNMTRAAEQLHVAQTALSMQIRQLEEELGVALLTRHSRGVEPTRAGALLHRRAQEIIALVERARSELAAAGHDMSESIRFGTTPALMPMVGADLAVHVREHLPQVVLGLIEEMSHVLIEQLSKAELDFILCYDVPEMPGILRTALLQDDLVLVSQAAGHQNVPIALVEALEETLAMPEEGDSVRSAVAKASRELGLELRVTYEIRSISAMRALAARGAASCILPYASVIDDARSGRLDVRPITMPPIRRTLFLASSRERGPHANEAGLIGAVRACLVPLIVALGQLCQPLWSRTA